MIKADLSQQELTTAAMVGVRRHLSAVCGGQKNHASSGSNIDELGFDSHIIGAMTEMIVARTFNLFWPDNVGIIRGCDVGGLIEVRCRRIGGSGLDLPVKAHDKPNKPYVLVHSDIPHFTMVGWLFGREAWQAGKSNGYSDLRYVPATVPPLHDINDLFGVVDLCRDNGMGLG